MRGDVPARTARVSRTAWNRGLRDTGLLAHLEFADSTRAAPGLAAVAARLRGSALVRAGFLRVREGHARAVVAAAASGHSRALSLLTQSDVRVGAAHPARLGALVRHARTVLVRALRGNRVSSSRRHGRRAVAAPHARRSMG